MIRETISVWLQIVKESKLIQRSDVVQSGSFGTVFKTLQYYKTYLYNVLPTV